MASEELIDLHIHTSASDGSFSPRQIVTLAKNKGLKAIGITDHDTIEGNEEALQAGRELGMEVVPGVEISVDFKGQTIHILGYYIDWKNEFLQLSLNKLKKFREERNPKIIKKLNNLGVNISYEEVKSVAGNETVVGRPHFAQVLINKGYVKDIDEAFKKYLKRGAPAYVEKKRLTPEEGIVLIKQAQGIPVLAHPYNIEGIKDQELEKLILQFKMMGIEGIEAFYPFHSPYQTLKLIALAEHHHLSITGGTDFHGEQKPNIQLGYGRGDLRITYDLLIKLKEKHGKNQKQSD